MTSGRPCMQDRNAVCILPVQHKALAESVGPGDELVIGRYLATQDENMSVRLKVGHVTEHEIHCLAECAPWYRLTLLFSSSAMCFLAALVDPGREHVCAAQGAPRDRVRDPLPG